MRRLQHSLLLAQRLHSHTSINPLQASSLHTSHFFRTSAVESTNNIADSNKQAVEQSGDSQPVEQPKPSQSINRPKRTNTNKRPIKQSHNTQSNNQSRDCQSTKQANNSTSVKQSDNSQSNNQQQRDSRSIKQHVEAKYSKRPNQRNKHRNNSQFVKQSTQNQSIQQPNNIRSINQSGDIESTKPSSDTDPKLANKRNKSIHKPQETVVNHLIKGQWDQALSAFTEQLDQGLVGEHEFLTFYGYISNRPELIEPASAFIAALWDAMRDQKVAVTRLQDWALFATSFDLNNDMERMEQLAHHLSTIPLFMPGSVCGCSIVLHSLAARSISHEEFQSAMNRFVESNPPVTLAMVQHRGTIESMLHHKQLDKAVEYLRSHASSMQVDCVTWTRVIVALCTEKRADEALGLYKYWLSVLPWVDELKQLAQQKSIVPDAYTYRVLLGQLDLPAEDTIKQLDEFGLPSTTPLHQQLIRNAMKYGKHAW